MARDHNAGGQSEPHVALRFHTPLIEPDVQISRIRRKGRQTDMLNLTPPRHTPTLPTPDVVGRFGPCPLSALFETVALRPRPFTAFEDRPRERPFSSMSLALACARESSWSLTSAGDEGIAASPTSARPNSMLSRRRSLKSRSSDQRGGSGSIRAKKAPPTPASPRTHGCSSSIPRGPSSAAGRARRGSSLQRSYQRNSSGLLAYWSVRRTHVSATRRSKKRRVAPVMVWVASTPSLARSIASPTTRPKRSSTR